jgi:thiol-disulfide isomerase/thioredoxin
MLSRFHMIRSACLVVALGWIAAHAQPAFAARTSAPRSSGAQARPGPPSGSAPASPIGSPSGSSAGSGQAKSPADAEFDALWKQYAAAVRDWEQARWEAGRKSQPGDIPHPAPKFLARFSALADKDNGDAQCWLIESLQLVYPNDEAAQVRALRELLPRLLAKHADIDAVARAVQGIKAQVEAVGEKQAVEMLQQVFDASVNAEVRAQALLAIAWLKMRGGTKDPERLAQARDLHRQIVLAFPGTATAKEVSGYLLPDVEKAFLDAEREWVNDVAKLVAAKRPIEEWPKQPIHRFDAEFQPLAAAGHHTAKQWVGMLYPAYQQVERQGTPVSLAWLVGRLADYYATDAEWTAVRLRMLGLLYAQFPTSTDAWLTGSLRKLVGEAQTLPADVTEAALRPLFDQNQDPAVRSLAMIVLAKSLMYVNDQASDLRALDLLTRLVEQYPDEDFAGEAQQTREQLQASLPGARAPEFFAKDVAGTEFSLSAYRGRVVMLVFFSLWDDECNRTVPMRTELMKKLEGKPFSLIGIDIDRITPKVFFEEAARRGVTWRTSIVNTYGDQVMQNYFVRRYPTAVVIDAEGVIRARNLPWDETAKLVGELVAQTK